MSHSKYTSIPRYAIGNYLFMTVSIAVWPKYHTKGAESTTFESCWTLSR